jgi:hypothetical protein
MCSSRGKLKEKKKNPPNIRNAVGLECFENALNWELVKIGIAVASQRRFHRRKLGLCFCKAVRMIHCVHAAESAPELRSRWKYMKNTASVSAKL